MIRWLGRVLCFVFHFVGIPTERGTFTTNDHLIVSSDHPFLFLTDTLLKTKMMT